MSELIVLAQAFASLAMVGVIWFVQVIHYPLFAAVSPKDFTAYERSHQKRTTLVVAPLMLLEAATAILLLLLPPANVPSWMLWSSGGLVVAVWASTFFWQVPLHEKLSASFDAQIHRQLVGSNWFRTALWTAKGILALVITSAALVG